VLKKFDAIIPMPGVVVDVRYLSAVMT
jgi:hypothetical protein